MLDHGLRVDPRQGIGGELLHRRRPPEALGACRQLGDDLLVRVPLADPSLEGRKRLGVDLCYGP